MDALKPIHSKLECSLHKSKDSMCLVYDGTLKISTVPETQ